MMKLSKNFTLNEMFKSSTADRLGIDNTTSDPNVIENLGDLVTFVWQPVRDEFGAVIITSGFRCLELNRELKSSDNSQHVLGEAIDGEALYAGNYEVASWIANHCEFDQLILEFYNPGQPKSGWVHCSYSEGFNRGEILTINKTGVYKGLIY